MSKPTVAILGASTDRSKYGNISLRAHVQQGYTVYPVNPKETEIEGITAYSRLADLPVDRVDRITVYLPPPILLKVLEDISKLPHDELWLNPGTESDEVLAAAAELSLDPIRACSIVALGVSPSDM